VADLERALLLDEQAQVLETDFVDDSLFSALLGQARLEAAADVAGALARLGHYRAVFPRGRHLADVETWSARLRGEGRDATWISACRDAVDAHAGHTETSLLLHLWPDAVRLDRRAAGNTDPPDGDDRTAA
jgi:hypothetical protein